MNDCGYWEQDKHIKKTPKKLLCSNCEHLGDDWKCTINKEREE